MKEYKILFSAPMVRSILAGKKTQTRRIIKPQPQYFVGETKMPRPECEKNLLRWTKGLPYKPTTKNPSANAQIWQEDSGECFEPIKCPFGQPGDVLWVSETDEDGEGYVYRANVTEDEGDGFIKHPWIPSIFMPRVASRILLEITDVRVERLQEITPTDAISEGIFSFRPVPGDGSPEPLYRRYSDVVGSPENWTSIPELSFRSLWEKINGPDSWAIDPYVWVISFVKL